MPTAIWNSPLRSGSAHCDLEVAVGIWTARRRRRTAIWKSRLGSGLRGEGGGGDGGGGCGGGGGGEQL